MKIKRFFASSMREAIQQVRREQGPDAVILSNKRVAGGVEIIAAVDYDESLLSPAREPASAEIPVVDDGIPATAVNMAQYVSEKREHRDEAPAPAPKAVPAAPVTKVEWSQEPTLVDMRREIQHLRGLLENQLSGLAWGETKRTRPNHAGLLQRLMALGLSPALCRKLTEAAPVGDDLEFNWRQALNLLAHNLPVTGDDILNEGGVVALVGPTGVGKTTSAAKLAARFALRHGRRHVALVTTDGFRIGAHEQLRTFGRLLGVPVHVANNGAELKQVLAELRDKKLVVIDTAGMSQRDLRLTEQFEALRSAGTEIKTYLVLSAAAQEISLEEAARAYRKVELSGCILTKIDEAGSLGGALSVVLKQQLPVAYLSDGQRVPEDLHPARAHNLINRGVMLMQENSRELDDDTLAVAFGGMAPPAAAPLGGLAVAHG